MSEEDLKVSQVHTSCKNCVFSVYKNKTQSGCKLNKIDDYKNAEIPVIEVQDGEKDFYVIDGRFCMFYRNEDVMQKYSQDSWEKIVKLQTKVPYHALIFIGEDSTFKEVKSACNRRKKQEVKPNMVTFINKQYPKYTQEPEKYLKPSVLLGLLSDSGFHKYNLKNVYNGEMDDRSLVDLVFDSSKDAPYPFYVVFESSFEIPDSFSKDLNDAILIKMMQIGFAKPVDEINGMIVNRVAHKKHAGNSFLVNLEDKIEKYEENGTKFIYEATEICPNLK